MEKSFFEKNWTNLGLSNSVQNCKDRKWGNVNNKSAREAAHARKRTPRRACEGTARARSHGRIIGWLNLVSFFGLPCIFLFFQKTFSSTKTDLFFYQIEHLVRVGPKKPSYCYTFSLFWAVINWHNKNYDVLLIFQ